MIKKFLCAFSIAYLFISLSVCKAQSDLIKVDLSEAPNCYAKTLRSDVELGNRLLKEAAPLAATKTTSELMIFFAEKLLNTPYVAGTLEGGEKEEVRDEEEEDKAEGEELEELEVVVVVVVGDEDNEEID